MEPQTKLTKICWLSRHNPLPAQIRTLKQLFGQNVVVLQYPTPFKSAEEIIAELKRQNIDKAVVVAPLSVISRLVQEKDILWLWAEMASLHDGCDSCKEFDPDKDVLHNVGGTRKHYRFVKFKKIVDVRVVYEDI